MTDPKRDKMLAEFEAWAKEYGYRLTVDSDGNYYDEGADDALAGYLAGHASRDTEVEALRLFAGRVLLNTRGENLGCDLDGGEVQEMAEECGLLHRVKVTEPCREEGCQCAEYNDWPVDCHRTTDIGRAAWDAARAKEGK